MGAMALALTLGAPARAEDSACRAAARRFGDTIILPAWCTVAVEHADRKARLARLARLQAGQAPKFYEYVVARDDLRDLLPQFPADIPVLRVVFDEGVFFDFDKSEVRPEAAAVLELIAESMRREPPDVAVFVAGHTDSIGSDAYNTDLAMRRADSVAHALLDRGAGASSVFRVSFGEAMPVDTNDTEPGRQHNRRVEFLFAAKPEAAAVWLAKQAATTCYQDDPAALARCRSAISLAEEVTRGSPRLMARAEVIEAPEKARPGRPRIDPQAGKAHLEGEGAKVAAPVARSYTVDLGRRTVTIGLPNR